jgi:hypothetical protein
MGSFNDVFVIDQAGHDMKPKDMDRVNSRLQRLQEEWFVAVTTEFDRHRGSPED